MSHPTFLDLPAADLDALGEARAVLLGAAEATPYVPGEPSHSAGAPAAIRAAAAQFVRQTSHHDFDLGFALFPDMGDRRGAVDAGDVATAPDDAAANRAAITDAVRRIRSAGAVPIVLGGDDSVPIPVAAGYEGDDPLIVVQVDAHADWGDRIRGEAMGYGSPMRRLSEMPWVSGMVQIGVRGLGSGGGWQIEDARAWGSRIVTGRDLATGGIAAALDAIPAGGRYLLSIDCDGLDPVAFPAVAMPTPGGIGYAGMIELLHALVDRGTIAGVVLAEYVPDRDDAHRSSAAMAARIVSVAFGLVLGDPGHGAPRPAP